MNLDLRATTTADRAIVDADPGGRAPTAPPSPRRSSAGGWLPATVAAIVLVAVFGIAIPLLADYDAAWAAVTNLDRIAVLAIAAATAWNLYSYWPVLTAALPGLRISEAMVVQQASTAVANTVPAGGAVGMAVTVRFLRAWGFTTPSITGQLVAVNAASLLVKLLMPVVALTLLALTGEAAGAMLWFAAFGVAVATALVIAAGFLLRDPAAAHWAGEVFDRLLQRASRRDGSEESSAGIGPWLLHLRDRLLSLARCQGPRLFAVTVTSHLSLFVVLLVALRAVGVSSSDVGWPAVFAAFAFVRLLSAVPVTPGGSGIVELGYVGLLVAEAPDGTASPIAAAVLLFRAATFLVPIALGALAWLGFHSMSSWRREPDSRGR